MEKQNPLQNFDGTKSEILKKRLLKSVNTSVANISQQINPQNNALLNTLRAPISKSMLVSSIQAPQNSMSIAHNYTQTLTPVKIHPNNHPYPLLSTVHVPVQIPGSTSNINVPVQLSGPTSTVPLQIAPVSLPLQVSGNTSVPVQLSAGDTINVPIQISNSQNIQLAGQTLPSMPLLHSTNQPIHSSIIHLHMASNSRPTNLDGLSELSLSNSSQLHMPDSSGVQIKMNTAPVSQVQVGNNQTVVQIPSSTNNTIQMRGTGRSVPHVVYIQTPSGLKPVTSTEVISQASTSGNPPQIIVRRPVTSTSNLQLMPNVSTRPNIAPKMPGQNKSSILAPGNASQPIVIQKPKANDKVMVPVSMAPGAPAKQAIAFLGPMKKPNTKNLSENQSILISNNQPNNPNNKLFLTPMNMPIMQNKQTAKFILPVTLPATMATKGPIINLQIANGQIQNDPQGNITVMRDTGIDPMDMPPLHPLGKIMSLNGKDHFNQTKMDNSYTSISIPGSRAEPTGEQGEYTLSIPETNSAMNDDIYTVSIEDDEGQTREESFTLAIPEKSNSLLNRNDSQVVAAPAILRRSNSDNTNSDRKSINANVKRRISLCAENVINKNKMTLLTQRGVDFEQVIDSNDDHRVPSLFCDEKLDKDLDTKTIGDSDAEEYKEKRKDADEKSSNEAFYPKPAGHHEASKIKAESDISEEDPPGLIWNNGVAVLQGSGLQFQTNEFGLIDLIDSTAHDLININAKYQTPLKQRIDRNKNKKVTSPEDLYRCEGCGCHGMAAEFITPNFCSSTCQLEIEKALVKRRERERADLLKKRNKMKKLLIRKQLSESDIASDNKDQEKVPIKHYDSTPAESIPEPAKPTEEIENEKYPWMCGKNGFSWMRYLDVCKAKAAPVKLFKNPFPYGRNGFRVGMRMEAIDPQHPALFCVVTVSEIQGYRMRLHFDEYPDMYDYWVNADCVDIFPPGWCEKNNRTLQPPASYTTANFSWPIYLKQIRAVAAPRQLFSHVTTTVFKPNCFRIGMKLEAEDRKNEMICAATVADMLDNRLRVNFDSWDDMYDYWVEPSSPYIHPVGWAEENGLPLTPPNCEYCTTTGWSPARRTYTPWAGPRRTDCRSHRPTVSTVRLLGGAQLAVHTPRGLGRGEPTAAHTAQLSPYIHPVGWAEENGLPLTPSNCEYCTTTVWSPARRTYTPWAGPRRTDCRSHRPTVSTVRLLGGAQLAVHTPRGLGRGERTAAHTAQLSPYIHPVGWAEENGLPLTPSNCEYCTTTGWSPARRTDTPWAGPRRTDCRSHRPTVSTIRLLGGAQLAVHTPRGLGRRERTAAHTVQLSPYIHPVGWAEENGLPLTPPNFYKDPDAFSWENYLSETSASSAPPRAFKTRLPQGFKPGMKLEVVDRR
ncbi:putative L, partial [Operophtera brumata]